MSRIEIGEYLVVDPEVCHGQLTFKGTRVPVEAALTFLAMGYTVDDVLQEWPYIERAAINEALLLASNLIVERYPGKKAA
ncbi:DUF433 domain-containing protein [Candidatus Poribacteria bacterium]|nr:DUF433 domain-containing protein [Candidatus Poribacteria bacterium]